MPLLTAKHHSHSEVCSEAQRARNGTTSGAGPKWPVPRNGVGVGAGNLYSVIHSYSAGMEPTASCMQSKHSATGRF